MKGSRNCTMLINDIVSQMQHPMINTSVKLRRFLTQYGIIADDRPDPVLVAKGFFIIEFRQATLNSGRIKNYSVVLVSQAGVGFIKKLASLIYG